MTARMDWLRGWLEENAKDGKFNADIRLSKEEAEQMRDELGVATILTGKEPDQDGRYSYSVSWRFALESNWLNEEQKKFIRKESWKFPPVGNFAERLCLIAKREDYR